jgi:prephenate dehydratase
LTPNPRRRKVARICIFKLKTRMNTPSQIFGLGPPGTYTDETIRLLYGAPATIRYRDGNYESLKSLTSEATAADAVAVVPIDNSKEGLVSDTRDFWLEVLESNPSTSGITRPYRVLGELRLPIRHVLAAKDVKTTLTRAMSHSQALGQCSKFLREWGLDRETSTSTAAAAAFVAKSPDLWRAAICSPFAARTYFLKVRREGIANQPRNETCFHVVGFGPTPAPTGRDRTTVIVELANVPGAHHDATGVFKEEGINLTSIHSIGLEPQRYAHYLEAECHQDDERGRRALEKLAKLSLNGRIVILGSYPQCELKGGAK